MPLQELHAVAKEGIRVKASGSGHIEIFLIRQGTGIGDAVNLGWKLASVIQNNADSSLLNTYERERKTFAETLVSTTDRVFKQLATTQKWKQTVRDQTIPLFAQAMKRSQVVKRLVYTVLSQRYITYEPSELNQGHYGKIKAGMRLPYSHGETQEFKREDGWQLHVFQKADEALIKEWEDRGIQVVQRKWTNQTK
ncbi:hypothetical protein GCM10008932_13990 [Alkalibacterium iburiense]|uniref:FAD-binding domain-containing protein n=1 Tax=Alkalibacterium iburiense TaxID=290589 RepID=A0ABN0XF36_9LACT